MRYFGFRSAARVAQRCRRACRHELSHGRFAAERLEDRTLLTTLIALAGEQLLTSVKRAWAIMGVESTLCSSSWLNSG